MQIQELEKQLKESVPPLVLILGEEKAIVNRAVAMLKALIPEDQKAMNFASYDLKTTPVAVALDDAMSPPFWRLSGSGANGTGDVHGRERTNQNRSRRGQSASVSESAGAEHDYGGGGTLCQAR